MIFCKKPFHSIPFISFGSHFVRWRRLHPLLHHIPLQRGRRKNKNCLLHTIGMRKMKTRRRVDMMTLCRIGVHIVDSTATVDCQP